MNKLSSSILILGSLLLTASTIRAQDYSNYRGFSLGASLATVLKQTDQNLADVTVAHAGPSPIQELTWWPPNLRGTSFRSESVEQILFSFHDGKLYKMSVTYDQGSTEGLTSSDMVNSISAKYGPASSVATVVDPASKDTYDAKGRLVASWEDTHYSFNLVRSYFTDRFGLIIYSKQANAEAELAIAEARLLAKQNGPRIAAELEKKQSDDLEVTREKNQKTFRP
ncbi:MAG: hypothetical protein WA639_11205 [Candidatus Acidiferrum sp.]